MIPGLCRRFALDSLRYIIVIVLAGTCLLTIPSRSSAQTSYYRHIFFDNGPRTSAYFYTSGKAVAPSTVEFQNGKLPLDSKIFLTPPNSIRLSWQSSAGGSWGAAVHVLEFRGREILFDGDTLSFWLFSPQAITASALPELRLHDTRRGFSAAIRVGEFCGDVPAKKWIRVAIPFRRIAADSVTSFDPRRLASLSFEQSVADATPHALFVDEIRIEGAPASSSSNEAMRAAPKNLRARAYERHVDLSWDGSPSGSGDEAALGRYIIYRSFDGSHFEPIGMQTPGVNRFTDFLGKVGAITGKPRIPIPV